MTKQIPPNKEFSIVDSAVGNRGSDVSLEEVQAYKTRQLAKIRRACFNPLPGANEALHASRIQLSIMVMEILFPRAWVSQSRLYNSLIKTTAFQSLGRETFLKSKKDSSSRIDDLESLKIIERRPLAADLTDLRTRMLRLTDPARGRWQRFMLLCEELDEDMRRMGLLARDVEAADPQKQIAAKFYHEHIKGS